LGAGYAFISAYLKGEEAKLLSSEAVSGISRTAEVQDVLDSIRGTDIGNYLEGVSVGNFDEMDGHLWTYLGECLRRLKWFKSLPSDIAGILGAYVVKYDVLNIKAALQGVVTGRKTRRIPVGTIYNAGQLDRLFEAENVENIAEAVSGCGLANYASILADYNMDEGDRARLLVEARLDAEYYRGLACVSRGMKDGATLTRVFGMMADMINLQIVLRAVLGDIGAEAAPYVIGGGYIITESLAREMMTLRLSDIPDRLENAQYRAMVEEIIGNYEKSRSLAVVEDTIDRNKFRMLREILAPRVMSPLLAVWYLIIKEIEVRNLRIILKSAFDGISVEEIRENLVLSS
jgi:V/A-type H+-transporting ATPase subunit C